jgi:phosphoribosylanthranilate isomerase
MPGAAGSTLYDEWTVEGATTKIKICGVTRLSDAELAVSLGAWAIGLIFDRSSPRFVEPASAAELGSALKRRVELVGVFVNASLDEVASLADEAALTMLQLHGDEGPSYCQEAARRTGLKVIKAAQVRDAASVRVLSAYKTDYHLLDAYVPGKRGGTGERFDWALTTHHPRHTPLILSGGLRPQNVREAIETVEPFAVDCSSGVESAPGSKDPDKLEQLFEAAREAHSTRV